MEKVRVSRRVFKINYKIIKSNSKRLEKFIEVILFIIMKNKVYLFFNLFQEKTELPSSTNVSTKLETPPFAKPQLCVDYFFFENTKYKTPINPASITTWKITFAAKANITKTNGNANKTPAQPNTKRQISYLTGMFLTIKSKTIPMAIDMISPFVSSKRA